MAAVYTNLTNRYVAVGDLGNGLFVFPPYRAVDLSNYFSADSISDSHQLRSHVTAGVLAGTAPSEGTTVGESVVGSGGFTTTIDGAFKLVGVLFTTIEPDPGPRLFTGTVDIYLDSPLGVAYDVLLRTLTLAADENSTWIAAQLIPIDDGDQIRIVVTQTGGTATSSQVDIKTI